MFKNRNKSVVPEFDIRFKGNWNYKDKGFKPIYTKPIVEMVIDKETFVWKHDEILRLIKAYYLADIKAIEMIKKGVSGEINNYETPFLNKLRDFINNLEKEEETI